MKNVLKLSVLLSTIACASGVTAKQPTAEQLGILPGGCISEDTVGDVIGTIGGEISREPQMGDIVGAVGGEIYRIESIDEDGRIHATVAVESLDRQLQAGDLVRATNIQYYRVESIELTEDPNYLHVVLVLTNLK